MEHAVSIVAAPGTPTVVIRETTTWERWPTLWSELLAEVWAFVRANGLQAGRNTMVYLDGTPTVEVGAELEGAFAGADGRVTASALPVGRAATAVARGAPSPEGIGAAHDAVLAWCREHGHELTGVRWELYDHWRDDPESFETNVYWQLAG
jgi:effector-binding domain-containing protein